MVSGQVSSAFTGSSIGEDHFKILYNSMEFLVLKNREHLLPNLTVDFTPFEMFLQESEKIELDFSYQLNNFGHRSDDFEEDSNYLLFAGCSFTFGEGLPYKQNWSGLIHEKITEQDSSISFKYYSLGYCGGSVEDICKNIISYINSFGEPKTIFALFPEFSRKSTLIGRDAYTLSPRRDADKATVWGDNPDILAFKFGHEKIKDLSDFANDRGIQFFWSTWSETDMKLLDEYPAADGYIKTDNSKILKMCQLKTRSNKKYYDRARDKVHPGFCYHSGVANIFLKEYLARQT